MGGEIESFDVTIGACCYVCVGGCGHVCVWACVCVRVGVGMWVCACILIPRVNIGRQMYK